MTLKNLLSVTSSTNPVLILDYSTPICKSRNGYKELGKITPQNISSIEANPNGVNGITKKMLLREVVYFFTETKPMLDNPVIVCTIERTEQCLKR